MRIFDPRLGRFLSTDPITKEYPDLSPYQFASNTPVGAIDVDGLESNKKFNLKEWLIDFGKGLLKGGAGIDLDNPFQDRS